MEFAKQAKEFAKEYKKGNLRFAIMKGNEEVQTEYNFLVACTKAAEMQKQDKNNVYQVVAVKI